MISAHRMSDSTPSTASRLMAPAGLAATTASRKA